MKKQDLLLENCAVFCGFQVKGLFFRDFGFAEGARAALTGNGVFMADVLAYFAKGIFALGWQQFVMYGIGGLLIWLAVEKKYEPMLLLPIGFGAILVNLPLEVVWEHGSAAGALKILFEAGIMTELFPLLIFVGVGAMIDFRPLLQRPWMLIFGIVAHGGIAIAAAAAYFLGFSLKEAASIGAIGAADGPTAIFVTAKFAPSILGQITVAAYSYMSLVPIIMPTVIKCLTTRQERVRRIHDKDANVSRWAVISFPIAITLAVGILVPEASALIGFLMFGNLVRECGVLDKLCKTAQNELSNIATLLLGISIGASMRAGQFLQYQTIVIMALGLVAFIGDIACGVLFVKLLNLFRKKESKLNPMLGACGISAFPMASRAVQRLALEEDSQNFILMHAVSANVSGQIGSVIIGGIILSVIPAFAG